MAHEDVKTDMKTKCLKINKKLWNDFLHYKIAIYCPTEQEANVFLKYLNNISFCWKEQGDLIIENNWNYFKEHTYYSYHFAFPKKIQYGTIEDRFLLNAKLIKIKDLFMNYSPNKLSHCTNNKL